MARLQGLWVSRGFGGGKTGAGAGGLVIDCGRNSRSCPALPHLVTVPVKHHDNLTRKVTIHTDKGPGVTEFGQPQQTIQPSRNPARAVARNLRPQGPGRSSEGQGCPAASDRWVPTVSLKGPARNPTHCGCQALPPSPASLGVLSGRCSGVRVASTQAPAPKSGTTLQISHQRTLAHSEWRDGDLWTLLEFQM